MSYSVGLALVVAGVALVFIGALMMVLGALTTPGTSGGLVVFVGPIPVVASWGEQGPILAALGVIIAVAMMVAAYVMFLRWVRVGRAVQ